MKKITLLILSLIFAFALSLNVFADSFDPMEYSVTYENGTAIVKFEANDLNAFDFGIIYDPAKVTLVDASYTDEFKAAQTNDDYTVLAVKNPAAQDDQGNTYVVFTGTAMCNEDGSSIPYNARPVATVTFSNVEEGDVVGIVSGTAQVSDIRNAERLGCPDLTTGVDDTSATLFDGAVAEKKTAANNNSVSDKSETNSTWLYGIIIVGVIIVAVVVIMISKNKNQDVVASDDSKDNSEDKSEE